MKKYEMTDETIVLETGETLHRVRALCDFGSIKKGDLGGFIQSEENLSHCGNSWIRDNAKVYGKARVCENAIVSDNSEVYGRAFIQGFVRIKDNAHVYCRATACDNVLIDGNSFVYGNTFLRGNAIVCQSAKVYGNARINGDVIIAGYSQVHGGSILSGRIAVKENANICGNFSACGEEVFSGNAYIRTEKDYVTIRGFGSQFRSTTFFRCSDGIIRTQCGCFYGDLQEFRDAIKNTHGNSKIAHEYLIVADLMDMHFKKDNKK